MDTPTLLNAHLSTYTGSQVSGAQITLDWSILRSHDGPGLKASESGVLSILTDADGKSSIGVERILPNITSPLKVLTRSENH